MPWGLRPDRGVTVLACKLPRRAQCARVLSSARHTLEPPTAAAPRSARARPDRGPARHLPPRHKEASAAKQAGLRPTAAAFFKFWLIILLVSMASGALGLAISAACRSVDAASAISPACEAVRPPALCTSACSVCLQALVPLLLCVSMPGAIPSAILTRTALWMQYSSSSSCLGDSIRTQQHCQSGLAGSGVLTLSPAAQSYQPHRLQC